MLAPHKLEKAAERQLTIIRDAVHEHLGLGDAGRSNRSRPNALWLLEPIPCVSCEPCGEASIEQLRETLTSLSRCSARLFCRVPARAG